jgi:hypothetical protein
MTIRPQPNDHPHLVRARLRLYGMRAAYDEVMTTGIKRRHEPSRIVGELLSAEIAEKPARSIKYQLTIAKLPPETCDVQAPHQRTGSGYGHRCNFPIASLSRRIHCGRSIPRLHRRNGPVRRHQRHPGLFQFTRPGVDPRVSAGEICISNPVNNMQIATTFTTGLWRLQPEYLSQRADTGAAAVFRAYFPCHQAAAPVPKPAPMPSANPGELASDIGAEYGLPPSGFYQYALDGGVNVNDRAALVRLAQCAKRAGWDMQQCATAQAKRAIAAARRNPGPQVDPEKVCEPAQIESPAAPHAWRSNCARSITICSKPIRAARLRVYGAIPWVMSKPLAA